VGSPVVGSPEEARHKPAGGVEGGHHNLLEEAASCIAGAAEEPPGSIAVQTFSSVFVSSTVVRTRDGRFGLCGGLTGFRGEAR